MGIKFQRPHRKSVHMGHKFQQCPQCENKFTREANLNNDQKSVHMGLGNMGQKFQSSTWDYQATQRAPYQASQKAPYQAT
jgi:hypothetical protein